MDFISVFEFLLKAFQKGKIDFALIGGLALQSIGITRATMDIDLLILSTNKEKIKNIMIKAGYKLIYESEDVLNFCSDRIELGRIDFLLAHRKYSLAMLKRAEEKDIFGGKFKLKVLKIEDQIGLKVQASSNDSRRLHQDMADIELLIRNNYSRLDLDVVKEYFKIFSREEDLNKIVRGIENAE